MFTELIEQVRAVHPDFSHEEIELFCVDFIDAMKDEKIKEETKMKRLKKYLEKEFELDIVPYQAPSEKVWNLDSIPEYLFAGKGDIASSLIQMSHVTKHIEQTHLFEDISFQVNKSDKIALIGKNGAGKTTLLKMILGLDIEYKGIIERAKGIKIGYLSQDLFWQNNNNTVKEEMLMVYPDITQKIETLKQQEDTLSWEEKTTLETYLREHDGYRKYTLSQEILKYFGFSDMQLDQHVLTLSGGEQTKVQIAKFLISDIDLLILDEPTNHLDIEGIIFLEKFCKIWKRAIISISHDIRFIDNTAEKIIEISGKKLESYPGNYQKYQEIKATQYKNQLKAYETQKKEIEKQEEFINRFRYQASKASGVQSRIKQVEKIERIEKPEFEVTVKNIHLATERTLPTKVIQIKDILIGYHPGNPIMEFKDELTVGKNEKIGIIGKNGSGKTTFLKTILGELPILSGHISLFDGLKVGSYSQVLMELDGKNRIIDELLKSHDKEEEIRSILGGLLIRGEKVEQYIHTLSGGERAKVALTKMLLTQPDIIIMDEPTNHLDIHSKEVIKNMIGNFNGMTIIVSHDRDLLTSISTQIWLIQDGKMQIFPHPEDGLAKIFNTP